MKGKKKAFMSSFAEMELMKKKQLWTSLRQKFRSHAKGLKNPEREGHMLKQKVCEAGAPFLMCLNNSYTEYM